MLVWVRNLIKPDFLKQCTPFDNTAQIYLINLHWKLGLGFKLRLRVALFYHFLLRIRKVSTLSFANFTDGNDRRQTDRQTDGRRHIANMNMSARLLINLNALHWLAMMLQLLLNKTALKASECVLANVNSCSCSLYVWEAPRYLLHATPIQFTYLSNFII